jgi:hypothetical protein
MAGMATLHDWERDYGFGLWLALAVGVVIAVVRAVRWVFG